ncbi:hypothetical protein [Kosakonia sacchari]|uniref:Uncharacterized protein n=1 Tax=Kosakonia sacchari TaxID=1158459 RepID=A0ABZ0MUI4_9ENTR|nr:hypothetical protein [Kosakonia sacchari]WOZ79100.1 hypothetical protein Q8Y70_08665 [Kosakonia sacchari]
MKIIVEMISAIDISEIETPIYGEFRYSVRVCKNDKREAIYLVDFKKLIKELYHHFESIYPEPDILNKTYMVEFYDIMALKNGEKRSQFDTYTDMRYTEEEREIFLLQGIGEVIKDFARQQDVRIIFNVPLRQSLAIIYDGLLKKHADGVNFHYRSDLVEEGLYVIEVKAQNQRAV